MGVSGMGPKSYHDLTAPGSCFDFIVFRQISVRENRNRAHPTFDLEHFSSISLTLRPSGAKRVCFCGHKNKLALPDQMHFLDHIANITFRSSLLKFSR
jgi:hypothetical protein